jgi:hypothetical protein
MTQVTTTQTSNEFRVSFPYNPDVIAEMKSRGGKWDATAKEWVFANGSMKNGELAIDQLFGSSEDTVTVQVGHEDDGKLYLSNAECKEKGLPESRPGLGENACGWVEIPGKKKAGFKGRQYLRLGGYLLASRRGRDYGAEIVETLVSGTIPKSGGSVKNPAVSASDDSVFELEVRRDFAERLGLIAELPQPLQAADNPLAAFTSEELQAELDRRAAEQEAGK